MKTIATTAEINIGQVYYDVNILLQVDERLADKLIANNKAVSTPAGIEAAIAARKAFIMAHWQPDAVLADREARVIKVCSVITQAVDEQGSHYAQGVRVNFNSHLSKAYGVQDI